MSTIDVGLLGDVPVLARDKLIGEFKSLWRTDDEVKHLKDLKGDIWEFIWGVYDKRIVDKWQMHLVIRHIHLAYRIETALETFHEQCPERGPEEPPLGIFDHIKSGLTRITQIRFFSNFQKEITAIKKEICELEKYRETHGIVTVGEGGDDIGGGQKKRLKRDPVHTIQPIGDPDIVGFGKDIGNILRLLLDENIVSRAVVSIVGIGGGGKSTIARKVYNSNDVKGSFDKVIFVAITRNYALLNVLREIAKKLNIESTDDKNGQELSDLIWHRLKRTRYLIVLDDVWTEDLWDEISKVLPDAKNGSKVIITTRSKNVAKKADTTYPPYNLRPLDDDESLKLFLKKAVPKNHQCPDLSSDLYDTAKQFAAKCGGLPLALELLGSLVSIKLYTFHAWKELLRNMTWQVDVRKCIDVVATSYEYLPLIEKLCFLYFAAFPESTEIEAKELLRIWSGDGLIRIQPKNRRTVEEIAECILEDLAQRNMVQVIKRFLDGSIEHIRVHDVLGELVIQKAQVFNFLMVCSKQDDWEHCSKALRLAIHYSSDFDEPFGNYASPFGNYASPNVYSLLIFNGLEKAINLDYSKFRMLRVFHCKVQLSFIPQPKDTEDILVKFLSFNGAPHLRYLQLGGLSDKKSEFVEWIRGMKYLETLDLTNSFHGYLSDCIWQAKTRLRHVLLNSLTTRAKGPPASITDLKNLQTLCGVRWNDSWETSSFPNIPNVRELNIEIPREIPPKEVTSLIGSLKHIVHLKITGYGIDLQEIATATGGCPFNENLKSLFVSNYGTLPLVLRDEMLPPYLIELNINGCKFGSDPMPVLEKLGILKSLILGGRTGSGENENRVRIKCSAGGFKQLELLKLYYLSVEEWEIEPSAMPVLKRLRVLWCDPLRVPPELINHLTSLQSLDWETNIQANKDAIDNIFEQKSLICGNIGVLLN